MDDDIRGLRDGTALGLIDGMMLRLELGTVVGTMTGSSEGALDDASTGFLFKTILCNVLGTPLDIEVGFNKGVPLVIT